MALLQTDFFSETLGMHTQLYVILPERVSGQIGMSSNVSSGAWKTLYLLHGLSDDHTIWQRRTSIERYVSNKPLAVIMPTTQRGWYTDMKIGFKWFTYFTEELPRVCKSFFPNISLNREDTFVAGLSMGGYGALKLGMSRPDIYSHAASLSGAVDIAEICARPAFAEKREMEDIFGRADDVPGSNHDLFTLAENLRDAPQAPRLYMCCGTEDFLYLQNVKLRNHIKKLGLDLTYEEEPGVHEWGLWDRKIQSVLKWLPLGEEGV